MTTTLRNVAIVLGIAALSVLIPGGGGGANTALQAVWLAFLAVWGWFAYTLYRQHRAELESWDTTRRAILYVAAGVEVLTVTGYSRLRVGTGRKIAVLLLLARGGSAA